MKDLLLRLLGSTDTAPGTHSSRDKDYSIEPTIAAFQAPTKGPQAWGMPLSITVLPEMAAVSRAAQADAAISIIDVGEPPPILAGPGGNYHLVLKIDDVSTEFPGRKSATPLDIDLITSFVRTLVSQRIDETKPVRLLIHCRHGQSRSPAAALVALASVIERDRLPEVTRILDDLPTALPNKLILSLGDKQLGCEGSLVAIVDEVIRARGV